MRTVTHADRWSLIERLRLFLFLPVLFCALSVGALAQLSGTYTIDPSGSGTTNYTSIDNAISALNTNGVSGAVTFQIAGGTYTAPTAGYTLAAVTGMSSTNTVTFRPASGATVIINHSSTSTSVATFNIDGGDYYILDGSNSTNAATRNWTVLNSGSGGAVQLLNGATNNIVRNMHLMAVSTSSTAAIVRISGSTAAAGGNSNNLISANTIGDSSGTNRSNYPVYMLGSSAAPNQNNIIDGNYIVNFGNGTGTAYAIYESTYNENANITHNELTQTVLASGGSKYGIYFSNSSHNGDTIAYNRIWNLSTASATTAQYGIYVWVQGSTPIVIHNNMVSLIANEGTLYGIGQTEPDSLYVYNNSVYIGGSSTTNTYESYAFYNSSSGAVVLKNNVLVNERTGADANDSRVLYSSSSSANLTSNYNLLYTNSPVGAVGYYGGTFYSSLSAWQNGTSFDANSVTGAPNFIDPSTGNLHISTTGGTPVESAGTPIAGLTTDIDGNTRSTTQPDLGADEGTFTPLFNNDLAADAFADPIDGGLVGGGTLFTPKGIVANRGMNSQTGVNVRYRIWNSATGTLVYDDVQTTGTITSGGTEQITFNSTGSASGSTSLQPGTYVIELRTELSGDQDTSNNAVYATISVRNPLCGTYTIDPNGTGANNFTSFTSAIAELNGFGVSCPVTFLVADGTYDATTETLPLVLSRIQGASATNTVTFRPANGAFVTITGSSSNYLVQLDGADYVTFNGTNAANGTTRDWKVINSSTGGAVELLNGATNNTIRNMNLMANSTSSTYSILRISASSSDLGGNSDNLIASNTIGDSSGVIRSSYPVYMLGSSAAYNEDNIIDGNYIVNFGNGTGTAYGIYEYNYNQGVRIINNELTQTVLASGGSKYGIYFSNSYHDGDTIAYNRIWNLNTESATTTQYGIYIWIQASTPIVIHDNMVSLIADEGTLYGISETEPDPLQVYNNSVYIGGSSTSNTYESYAFYNSSSGAVVLKNNVLVNEREGSTANEQRVIYNSSSSTNLTSDYNLLQANGNNTVVGYSGGTYYATLDAWQSGTTYDDNSVTGRVPYVDPANGDLHIDPTLAFHGESAGTPIAGLTLDFDKQTRNATYPDIGADEGNFNGEGIVVVYPNGGEELPGNYQLTTRFTTNRPMSVRIELSLDGGKSWTTKGTIDETQVGLNTFVLTTPDTVVSTARVRVISTLNQWELDISNSNFSLVRPVFTVIAPNGGETLVPTDTVAIRWSSDFVPPSLGVEIDYSTNGGQNWNLIASDVKSANIPSINTYNWIVPNTPTQQALVRVRIPDSESRDSSDAVFTIRQQPQVVLTAPNGDEDLFVGEKRTISWTAVTTDYVTLEYSTDGGKTWNTIIRRVPAYVGSYEWTVPNTTSNDVLVRVVNYERPRFTDQSNDEFAILKGVIQVLAPNGGEKYELSQPVTVRWSSQNVETVRIEYSTNNGFAWTTIASGINAELGSYTFTPDAIPTRLAVVRVTDEDQTTTRDRSDMPFEIVGAKSISVLSPGQGDQLLRGSTTVIAWDAPRVNSVTIQYSSNGGSSWTTIVSNVQASLGNYVWNVPNTTTTQGKIRILEVGGNIVGESGIFSIVEPTVPVVQVLSPNGGENYVEGDPIQIRWSATSDLTFVTLSYSADGGNNWTEIASGIPAGQAIYNWAAPNAPGTQYRVRVDAGVTKDMSDANFSVERKLVPKITVITPNGGETLTVGDEYNITWDEEDLTDTEVKVEYSTDGGESWTELDMVAVGTKSYLWTVPDEITTAALVRVSASNTSDKSDTPFEIKAKVLEPIRVITPNGGEMWVENQTKQIEWEAPADVTQVELHYSTDGGQTWQLIAGSASVAGTNSYDWTVPQESTTQALVRVRATADTMRLDISDNVFSIEYSPSSVPNGAVAGRNAVNVLGNFPNPFAATTELRWTQGISGAVTLRMYDGNGRVIRMMDAGRMEAGEHRLTIEAGELPSGTYHYELRVGSTTAHGVMMVVR